MMSDFILLSHTDLRPVLLLLLPQSLSLQHTSTYTELPAAHNPLNSEAFVSSCHPHAVTQICHSVNPFSLHIPFDESWVNMKPSWDTFLRTLIAFLHIFIT
ncbi:uncharacterized protein ACO6RY_12087 [Pungitius sinensis]